MRLAFNNRVLQMLKQNLFMIIVLSAIFYVLNIKTLVFEVFLLLIYVALAWSYPLKQNHYFRKVLLFWISGVLTSFAVTKYLIVEHMPVVTTGKIIPLVILAIAFVCDLIRLRKDVDDASAHPTDAENNLFRERKYDLQRVYYYLQNVPIVGLNAPYGEGKSFLANMIYHDQAMRKRFTFIQVDLLTCNLDNIESILLSKIEQVLQSNGIYSSSGKQYGNILRNFQLSSIMYQAFKDEQPGVASTFLGFQNDIQRLDKDILIVFDDLDRIPDRDMILKIFAIAEKLSGDKIHILFQCDYHNLPWDRDHLKKYIPYVVNLTELTFERIVSGLWNKCRLDEITYLKDRDIQNITMLPVRNVILNQITELKAYSVKLPIKKSVRIVELYLRDLHSMWDMNIRFQNRDSVKCLAKILFIQHFLPDKMEAVQVGESLPESLKLVSGEDVFSVQTLIQRYRSKEYSEEDCIHIVKDPVNDETVWILGLLQYDLSIPDKSEDRRWFANESLNTIRRQEYNAKIDHYMWNVKGHGNSEYTDMEWYAKEICEKVLSQPLKDRYEAWTKVWDVAFYGCSDKNNTTVQLFEESEMLAAFKALYVTRVLPDQWLRMIEFYFSGKETTCITVDMIEILNYVSLNNKDILLAVIREFNERKVIGNMNEEKGFGIFLYRYLDAIWMLGYSTDVVPPRDFCENEESFLESSSVKTTIDEYKSDLQKNYQEALFDEIKQEYQLLLSFIDKCKEIMMHNTKLQARSLRVNVQTRTRYEHDDLFRSLQKELEDISDENKKTDFIEKLRKLYISEKLNPHEYGILAKLLQKHMR